MKIFRAVSRTNFDPEREHTRHPGTRLPANVPYLVDNLWEFTRPDDMPSRRNGVYASPTAALALDGAAGVGQPQDGFIACRVACRSTPKIFQMSVADARYHPDVKRLQKTVHDKLVGQDLVGFEGKLALAPLFVPGMTRDELKAAMEGNAGLRDLVMELATLVTLWTDTPNSAVGELFFEIDEDNHYKLHPV
ncbi:hypothetical protein [Noviherbaspirillum suwonense]|uniref:Uncharacterized protein n=1 Tax=Noviherbaspirillum suwonense TaxID=1224511 RepID=A0ABY1QSQ9_9BURK|nr:hypothetical protein [Noviherbaspirillum suwonense]SMP79657.1 hypothetical protein SAMN06295970_13226 [Noviherbaspirillum suwonense]